MKYTAVLCALAASLLLATPARAGDELLISPIPAWVEQRQLGGDAGDSQGQPARILTLDNQLRLEPGERTIFTRLTLKIENGQGLSAGNLSLPWQPEFEELTVHKLLIHRGEEAIDVLGSGQSFTIIRREQNLEQATLDGVLTANIFPEGLRVGDIIEIASTLVTRNPVFENHVEVMMGPFNFPAQRVDLRVQWPKSLKLKLQTTAGLPEWTRSVVDGENRAELSLADVEPILPPRFAPIRYGLSRLVEASDFASWAELSSLFDGHYASAAKLPADGPLREEVERIRAASKDPVVRTEMALKLVQERVRYVALAMGAGGLVPADAELTWSRRFGDCKAKTALLLAILGELGIEAQPVFVNSGLGDGVADRLPMVGAFDHVIVRAIIGGKDYWLDGTRTGDTALDRLEVPNFGWGLPVQAKGAKLVRLLPEPLAKPDSELTIHLDASNGLHVPAPARLERVLRGYGAIATNAAMAGLVGDARDRTLRDYWRQSFDFVKPDRLDYSFDEASGEARLTLEGMAEMDWDGSRYEADDMQVGYRAEFTRDPGPASDAPFAVSYPYFERAQETILLPRGFADSVTGRDRPISGTVDVDEVVAGIHYRRKASIKGNVFEIERLEKSVAPEFPAAGAPAAQKRLRALQDQTVYLRIPQGYRPAGDDLAALVEKDATTVWDLIRQGNLLLNAGRFEEALDKITSATKLDPGNDWAWANHAIGLVNRGDLEEAERSIARADNINPRNSGTFNARGMLGEVRNDRSAAIAAYTAAIELDSTQAFSYFRRASLFLDGGELEAALADARKAIEISPQSKPMYALAASVLAQLDREDEVVAAVDAMLAVNPDDPSAIPFASKIFRDLGMEEKADGLLARFDDDNPTASALLNRSLARVQSDTDGRLADLEDALKLEPDMGGALDARAALYASIGERELELLDLTRLIELHPSYTEAYLRKATALQLLGRSEEGIALAGELVVANPGNGFAHVAAAKILEAFDEREKAFAEIDAALALKPEPYIHLNRAELHDAADYAARLADIDAALEMDAKFIPALVAKARILAKTGDLEGEAAAYGRMVELAPQDPELFNAQGIALWRLGRTEDAEAAFARAKPLAVSADQLNNLCFTKAMAGVALDRALSECDEALKRQPDFWPYLDSRATALVQLGRYDEAIADLDKALAKNPTLSPSLYARALAWAGKGDLQRANKDANAARAVTPDIAERFVDFAIKLPDDSNSEAE